MTTQEFSTEFDVLYDNISSGQAPGLTEYEKSVFLTKAQDEIVKNYINPKGNKYQEGLDDSSKRQVDFSPLIVTYIGDAINNDLYNYTSQSLHNAKNSAHYEIPSDLLIYVNEFINVERNGKTVMLAVVPLSYDEYYRLMSKPFKRPLKNQAWRLISRSKGSKYQTVDYENAASLLKYEGVLKLTEQEILNLIKGKKIEVTDDAKVKVNNLYLNSQGELSSTGGISFSLVAPDLRSCIIDYTVNTEIVQIVPGVSDKIISYIIRYIRKPKPIILEDLSSYNVSIDGIGAKTECELHPSLHQEILQRAVELAKSAYTGDLSSAVELGQRSE